MTRRRRGELLILAAFLVGVVAAFGEVEGRAPVTSSYIAPVSAVLYRFWQPDGVVRELDLSGPDTLQGGFGWKGVIKGDRITLWSGSDVSREWQGTYVFRRGRLVAFSGRNRYLQFDWKGSPLAGTMAGLWPNAVEDTRDFWKDVGPWRKSRRLKFWFQNPNRVGTLFAEVGVALLALLAFLLRRGRSPRMGARTWIGGGACVLGLAASVAMMYLSGSRSAFVAFLLAAAAFGFFGAGGRFAGRRRAVVFGGLAVLLAAALFAVGLQFGFWEKRARGNALRKDILRALPQMMCDAPGGWGFVGAGRAYRDWYQRLDDKWVTFSLVSDHLTTLVDAGWPGRFAYVFGWLALLALLALAARNHPSARLAFALWLVMGVSSSSNRIYLDAASLWIAPGLTLAWAVARLPRRRPDRRVWLVLAGAAVVSASALGFCALAADGKGFDVRVRTDGKRILVKSAKPSVWIVDDGCVLGGGLVGKELHAAYAADRGLSGVGYVSSVFGLPPSGVRRLILAGMSGYEFLTGLSEGRFPADFQVPSEIVFVSPPFPPSVVPELLLKNAKVRLLIGEFAAAYDDEYRSPPPWVTVVPGCELYVSDWIVRCLVGS